MNKRLTILFFAFSIYFPSFLNGDVYDDFNKFRISLYNKENVEEVNKAFDEWENNFTKQNLTDEEKITLKNLFVLEKLSILKDEKKKVYKLLIERDKESTKFIEGKTIAKLGKWFCLSFGDIKSRLLSYVSWLEAYNASKLAKQYYEDALKKDKNFSQAHISNALYLFFAPAIAGGGYEASLKECNLAVSSAKNNEEKYLALIFRSQVNFKLKHIKEYEEDLKLAHTLIANEIFTKQITMQNKENAKVFFE
ncbi:MAG: hypothetical protein ACTTKH_05360 [Treponema sp.]